MNRLIILVLCLAGCRTIHCGDNVQTAPIGEVTVLGAVMKPGTVAVFDGTPLTVISLIEHSGGLRSDAATNAIWIFRFVPGRSERDAIRVDVNAINTGEANDPELRPHDIVLVQTGCDTAHQKE